MKLFRIAVTFLVVYVTAGAIAMLGQNAQFKGHRIGESAEQFYSIAMTENKGLAKDWCRTLLSDPGEARKIVLNTDLALRMRIS